MKKRVLLTILFVMLLSLLVAFTASAQDYELVDDLGDPSWYTGNYEYMTDKTSQVVLVDSEGNYTAYPAYYILKYSITVKDGAISEAYINGFDYSHVSKNGKSYEAGAIYKIELPNGLTTIKSNYFGYYPVEANVVELVMPDTITTVEAHAFRNDKSSTKLHLKKVVFSKNLTSIGACAFLSVTTLEEVVFPAGSDAVLDMSNQELFSGCQSLQSIDLSTRKVEKIGKSCFSNCKSLGKVTLPDTITSFENQCFYYCTNMYFASDFLPKSLKNAGFHFLSGCTSINDVLYFPDGFETFGSECFDTSKGNPGSITLVFLGRMTGTITLNKLAPRDVDVTLVFTKNTFADLSNQYVMSYQDGDTIGFLGKSADGNNYKQNTAGTLSLVLGNPADMTSKIKDDNGNTYYYINTSKCNNIYFCGGDTVEYCRDVRTTVVTGSYANFITSPFVFDRQGHMDAGVHYDLTEVVSIANCGIEGIVENTCVVCDRVAQTKTPATGNHTLSQISPCADKCSVCELYIQRAEQSHILNEIITYLNGYDAQGEYKATCSNEGCTHVVTEITNAIFAYLGYSAPMSGNGGIAVGFSIDNVALNTYEEITGKTLSFGVFAAAQQKLGESTIFDEDGNAMTGTITADLSSYVFDAFEIKIVGFAENQKDLKLVMGAYATEDGVKYSYLQSTNVGSKMGAHYAVSYNEVVASLVANEAA